MEYTFTKAVQNPDRLLLEIISAIATIPLYINTSGTTVTVVFLSALSAGNITTLTNTVNAHVLTTSYETAAAGLAAAKVYGVGLIDQFTAENAVLGITASGKTRQVAAYLADLRDYVASGSLYAAIDELTSISNDLTLPLSGMSPYVTSARAKLYRGYIQTYLGIPVTP